MSTSKQQKTKPIAVASPTEQIQKIHKDWKYRYKYEDVAPSEKCHKCGKGFWSTGDDPFSWSCVCCGNILYFTLGAFHQQIDAVLRSERRSDYVRNEEGTALLPKKNNDLKNIEFNKKLTGSN